MKELIQAAVIDPAALTHAAAEQQVGLHQPADAEPLTAGDALLWYSSIHLFWLPTVWFADVKVHLHVLRGDMPLQ